MKQLTVEEKKLLYQFAAKMNAEQSAHLKNDIEKLSVVSRAPDNSTIVFDIQQYTRPTYKGQHQYPIEARMQDEDGTEITVVLYADENGRVLELEFIRWDEAALMKPNWESLVLHPAE